MPLIHSGPSLKRFGLLLTLLLSSTFVQAQQPAPETSGSQVVLPQTDAAAAPSQAAAPVVAPVSAQQPVAPAAAVVEVAFPPESPESPESPDSLELPQPTASAASASAAASDPTSRVRRLGRPTDGTEYGRIESGWCRIVIILSDDAQNRSVPFGTGRASLGRGYARRRSGEHGCCPGSCGGARCAGGATNGGL